MNLKLFADMDPVLLSNNTIVYIGGYDQKKHLFGKIAYVLSEEGSKIIQDKKYRKNPFSLGDSRWNNFKEEIEKRYSDFTCEFDLDPHAVSFSRSLILSSPDPFEIYSKILEEDSGLSEMLNYLSELTDSRLGIIGSILLGSRNYGDIDLLVFGKDKFDEFCQTLRNNPSIKNITKEILLKKQFHEYRKVFPNIPPTTVAKMIERRSLSRFFINETEVSLWARYGNTLGFSFYETKHKTGDRESIETFVTDDIFSEYFPILLRTEGSLDGIVIFNRFFRSALKKGDKISTDGIRTTFYTGEGDLEFLVLDYNSSFEIK